MTDLNDHPNLAIFRQSDNGVLVRMALFRHDPQTLSGPSRVRTPPQGKLVRRSAGFECNFQPRFGADDVEVSDREWLS